MNPLRVTAANYRTFRELDLFLPTGCTVIAGANEAGKSSLVQLIELALFGARGRALSDYLSDGADGQGLELSLEFEHRGGLYRVRRVYASGRSARLDLEVAAGDVWEPDGLEAAAATQEKLERLLGLTRDTFRASAMMAQGDGAAFTRAQPRDRKRVLAEVLGLDMWQPLLEIARRDLRDAELELARLRGQIDSQEAELAARDALERRQAELGVQLADMREEAANAERCREQIRERIAQTATLVAEQERSGAELALAEERLAQLDRVKREAAEAGQELAELQRRLPELDLLASDREQAEREREQLNQQRQEAADRRIARDHLLSNAANLMRDAETLTAELAQESGRLRELRAYQRALESAPAATCDRCGQPLHLEARVSALDSVRVEADEAEARHKEKLAAKDDLARQAAELDRQAAAVSVPHPPDDAAYQEIGRRIKEARQAELDAHAHRTRIDVLAGVAAMVSDPEFRGQIGMARSRMENASRVYAEAQQAAPSPREQFVLREEAQHAEELVQETRGEIEAFQALLARCEGEIDRLRTVAEGLAEARARIDALARRIAVLKICERLYGAGGIPAVLIEAFAVPAVEADATRLLSELGLDFRVELRTQRELKGGGLAEALDIVVQTPTGARPFEALCGSEQERVNITLRIGLARLLAHRRGADIQLLVIDEPAGLDERNALRFAAMLRGLERDFDRILVVSHLPALREAFDQAITVERDGEWSRIVDSSGGRADSASGRGASLAYAAERVPDAQGPGLEARSPAPPLLGETE